MRDLSFQEALQDPDMPFWKFVEACIRAWSRAVAIYEAAGGPNGPAGEGTNVTTWLLDRIDQLDAVKEIEDLLALDSCTD